MENNNNTRTQDFLSCLGNGRSLPQIETEEENYIPKSKYKLITIKSLIKEIEFGGRI